MRQWRKKRFAQERESGVWRCIASLILALTLWLPALNSIADDVGHSRKISFDIPQQSADQALIEFAEQADVTFIFPFDEARGQAANPLVGEYTIEEAIETLLNGTTLQPEFSLDGVMTILSDAGNDSQGNGTEGAHPMAHSTLSKSSFFTHLGASVAAVFAVSAHAQTEDAEYRMLEEVIVTATKREANIQDIPASITALSGLEIERRGMVSMDDYLSTIPGVNMADRGVSTNKIIIRGVNASIEEDSTVGIFFGEVPLNTVSRGSTADLKMVDL